MSERARIAAQKTEAKKENSVSRIKKADFSQSINSPIDQILFLQRTIGNQAVQRLLKSGMIQAKLRIGQPGEIYEQEADRVTDEVMRMPEPSLQRQAEEEEEEEALLQPKLETNAEHPIQGQAEKEEEEEEVLQTKGRTGHCPEVTPELEHRIQSLRGGGQPLPKSVRTFFEPRFGYDFRNVRIYRDSRAADTARAVNARAFTVERDVVFGAGQYVPKSSESSQLLAHELTHIVQQRADLSFRGGRTDNGRQRDGVRPINPTPIRASSRIIFAKALSPGSAPSASSLALDIIQGKLTLNLVFYRSDVLSQYPDVQRHAERLAAEIKAPRIPPQWALGACSRSVLRLRLAAGATRIRAAVLPWIKGASNCLSGKKVSEVHLFGHLDAGLELNSSPGPELKQYVAPDVRLFFHGCLVAQWFGPQISVLLDALRQRHQLGQAAKVFAHWEAGEPGRPVDFFEITLPRGQTAIRKKFVDDYSKVLPKKYIWAWARNETTSELYRWLRGRRERRLARDIKKIVITVLSKRLRRGIRQWSLQRLRRRLTRPIYDWERRVLEKRISELESRGLRL
jgi:Domain of unknown function (DUF4157)